MAPHIELIVSPPLDLPAQALDRLPAIRTAFALRAARVTAETAESYWLQRFGIPHQQDWPVAAYRARSSGSDYLLCADPVGLDVNGDAVVLDAGAASDLSSADAAALTMLLNAHFAQDGVRIEALTPTHWVLAMPGEPQVRTTPLAQAHRRSIEATLPQGADARRLKRIATEAQMLLHEAAVNQRRQSEGRAAVNGVWLWGGGRRTQEPARGHALQVRSADPHVIELAGAAGGRTGPLPDDAAALDLDGAAGSIALDLDSGFANQDAEAWLSRFDQAWLTPLHALARQGRCSASLTLLLTDMTANAPLFKSDWTAWLRSGGLAARIGRARPAA
jgi:hypothetical protein